ncbi:MAG: ribosome silencing factor [Chloroflexi bacterium]|nr:ribosome silencing factor [Chloroflexota bacterium]
MEIARRAVELASDKQAEEIVLLDTRQACSFTDYVVICNGESDRQLDAIRKEIVDTLKSSSVTLHKSEGNSDSGWILMDYAGVIIHIFSRELRNYYRLDSIYEKALQLVRIQ